MYGVEYPYIKVFAYEKSYRILCDLKEMIDSAAAEASSERDVIMNYKLVYNDIDRMTLVWKYKSIEPIILINRQKEFLVLTYNFTSLGEVTCGAMFILICTLFISGWQSIVFIPRVLFFMGLTACWIKALRTAKQVNKYFKRYEVSYDDLCDKIQ